MSRTTQLIAGSLLALVVMVGSSCSASTEKSVETTTTVKKDASKTRNQSTTTAKDVPVDEKKDKPKKTPTVVSGSFCEMAEGYGDVMSEALTGAFSLGEEPDEAQMFEAFQTSMVAAFDYLKDMAKVAPAELKADMKLLIDASDDYMDAVKSSTSMDDPAMQQAEELMDAPELDAASDRMDEYMKTTCGVDLDAVFSDGS